VEGYLLDTCFISALLNGHHENYENARRAEEAIENGAPRYVSRITIAELSFGCLLDQAATGRPPPNASEVLRRAQEYIMREVTKHTATEYAQLKTKIATTYLTTFLRSNRPRWIDQWPARVRGETLQIDENDLWICAQALEHNLVLLTTDRNMVERIQPADSNIRFQLVPGRS
jgi:tRNA(fMet)-specific endonuclease VapC